MPGHGTFPPAPEPIEMIRPPSVSKGAAARTANATPSTLIANGRLNLAGLDLAGNEYQLGQSLNIRETVWSCDSQILLGVFACPWRNSSSRRITSSKLAPSS